MKIEEPETPLQFPVREAVVPEFKTIGMFYSALIRKIAELGDSIFTGSPGRQVVVGAGFAQDRLFPITGVETATTALRWILEDGEGTSTSPLDVTGEPAHYYRFAEIFHGRSLVASPDEPTGFAYAGTRIAFAPEDVCDFPDNPKAADYAPGTFERDLVDAFNLAYSNVLRDLQIAFDGRPAHHPHGEQPDGSAPRSGRRSASLRRFRDRPQRRGVVRIHDVTLPSPRAVSTE